MTLVSHPETSATVPNMTRVELDGVHVDGTTNQPVILLKESGGNRQLPIFIGAPEAAAIVYALQGLQTPRPLTHDLTITLLDLLSAELRQVRINKVVEGTFYSEMVFDHAGKELVVSARPSDAIALAVRSPNVQLEVDDYVMEIASILLESEVAPPSEEELNEFRQFLKDVRPEDFDNTP